MPWQHDDGYEHGMLVAPWDNNTNGTPGTVAVDGDNPGSGNYSVHGTLAAGQGVDVETATTDFARVGSQNQNLGLSIRVSDWSEVDELWFFTRVDGSDNYLIVNLLADGDVEVYNNDTGLLAGLLASAGAGTVGSDGVRYDIEFDYLQSPSVGTVNVAVDGGTEIAFGPGDTASGSGSNLFIGWGFHAVALGGGAGFEFWVDDLRIGDSMALQGPKFHPPAIVATSTVAAQGIGSDADSTDNHLLVDDVPLDAGAEYVEWSAPTEEDEYGHSGITDTGQSIDSVSVWLLLSDPNELGAVGRGFIESNASRANGDNSPGLGATPVVAQSVYELLDPDTAAAWTVAGFNAATFGVEAVSV